MLNLYPYNYYILYVAIIILIAYICFTLYNLFKFFKQVQASLPYINTLVEHITNIQNTANEMGENIRNTLVDLKKILPYIFFGYLFLKNWKNSNEKGFARVKSSLKGCLIETKVNSSLINLVKRGSIF